MLFCGDLSIIDSADASSSHTHPCSAAQVTQLQSVMRQHEVGEGEVIWRKGDEVLDVVLVGDARLAYRELD